MTQEDKELLLKDLCARLPYGVRVFVSGDDFDNYQYPYLLTAISKFGQDSFCKIYSPIYTPLGCPGIENVKPYLFPLSSMTREQLFEVQEMLGKNEIEVNDGFLHIINSDRNTITYLELLALLEWFYKNHFDIDNIISKGLAIDATNLNIY